MARIENGPNEKSKGLIIKGREKGKAYFLVASLPDPVATFSSVIGWI